MTRHPNSSGFFRKVNHRTASFCLALVATVSIAAGLACASRPLPVAAAAPVLASAGVGDGSAMSGQSAHKLTRSPVRIFGIPSLRPAEAPVTVARA